MSSLLDRLKGAREQVARLGLRRTIQLRVLRRLGVKELRLFVPGIKNRVAVRIANSDIYEFNQSLGPWQEPLSLDFEPRIIVDAGANVGYTILRFFQQFPQAEIIAIEPDQANLEQLARNCSGYENLKVEAKALWSHAARLAISNPNAASNAFIVVEDEAGAIEATSIPDIMNRHSLDCIDLLKIDIEGSEKEVFEHPASQAWLPRVRALLVETHDNMREGTADAVRRATAGHMTFRGYVNEYELYVSNASN